MVLSAHQRRERCAAGLGASVPGTHLQVFTPFPRCGPAPTSYFCVAKAICLLGSACAGRTVLGRLVGRRFGKSFVEFEYFAVRYSQSGN